MIGMNNILNKGKESRERKTVRFVFSGDHS